MEDGWIRMDEFDRYLGQRVVVCSIKKGDFVKVVGMFRGVDIFNSVEIEVTPSESRLIKFIDTDQAIREILTFPDSNPIFKNPLIKMGMRWGDQERKFILLMSYGREVAWKKVLKQEYSGARDRFFGWFGLVVLDFAKNVIAPSFLNAA